MWINGRFWILKKRTQMADNITLGLDRLFVRTANDNMVLIGHTLTPPIIRDFSDQRETTLSDDDEGEEWKLSD